MDTRQIHEYLCQWGDWVRHCNRIPMGVKSSITETAAGFTELGFEADIDILVNRLKRPFPDILRRYYVDPRPESNHYFYPAGRSVEQKARDENMTVATFKNALQIARHLAEHEARKCPWWQDFLTRR